MRGPDTAEDLFDGLDRHAADSFFGQSELAFEGEITDDLMARLFMRAYLASGGVSDEIHDSRAKYLELYADGYRPAHAGDLRPIVKDFWMAVEKVYPSFQLHKGLGALAS